MLVHGDLWVFLDRCENVKESQKRKGCNARSNQEAIEFVMPKDQLQPILEVCYPSLGLEFLTEWEECFFSGPVPLLWSLSSLAHCLDNFGSRLLNGTENERNF